MNSYMFNMIYPKNIDDIYRVLDESPCLNIYLLYKSEFELYSDDRYNVSQRFNR